MNAPNESSPTDPYQDLIEICLCIVVVDFLLKMSGWDKLQDVQTVLKTSLHLSKPSAYVVYQNLSSMVKLLQELG